MIKHFSEIELFFSSFIQLYLWNVQVILKKIGRIKIPVYLLLPFVEHF